MEQPIIQNVRMRCQLEIWLINIPDTRRGTARNERTNPVCVRIAQGAGTEGMDVHRNRAGDEAKITVGKRSPDALRIPAVIQGAVAHRITFWKEFGRGGATIHDRYSDLVQLLRDFRQPFIADLHSERIGMRTIDVRAARSEEHKAE